MRALTCPACKGPSNPPLWRLLSSRYQCDACFKAEQRKNQRKQKAKRAERAGRVYTPAPEGWFWTPEEDEAVRNGARELPGRTERAIEFRRSVLGVPLLKVHNPWNEKDKAFFMRHYKTKSARWIADQLGRPLKSVQKYAERNKIKSGYSKPRERLYRPTERQRGLIPDVVQETVPRNLFKPMRDEVVNMMIADALQGLLKFSDIKGAYSTYKTKYYALYPNMGAHKSMDEKVFEDGTTTLGDTISSDVFRF